MLCGLTLFILGNLVDPRETGHRVIFQTPAIALGMSLLCLPVVAKPPGRLEVWAPGRLLAWVGVISYTVLIVNEPLRSVTHTMTIENARLGWQVLWVGALYMPITLIVARPLAVLLGLVERGSAQEAALPAAATAAGSVPT